MDYTMVVHNHDFRDTEKGIESHNVVENGSNVTTDVAHDKYHV